MNNVKDMNHLFLSSIAKITQEDEEHVRHLLATCNEGLQPKNAGLKLADEELVLEKEESGLNNKGLNPEYKELEPEESWQETRTKRSEEHTSELQSRGHLVCRLLLEKKKNMLNTRKFI